MTTEHTMITNMRTPWRLAGPRNTVIEDCDGNTIGFFDDVQYPIGDNAARAKTSVHAVNSHVDLVAICQTMRNAWSDYLDNPDAIGCDIEGLVGDADAILSKIGK